MFSFQILQEKYRQTCERDKSFFLFFCFLFIDARNKEKSLIFFSLKFKIYYQYFDLCVLSLHFIFYFKTWYFKTNILTVTKTLPYHIMLYINLDKDTSIIKLAAEKMRCCTKIILFCFPHYTFFSGSSPLMFISI